MAKKISQLTTITNIDSSTYVPVVQGVGVEADDYKMTPANIYKAETDARIAADTANYDLLHGGIMLEKANRETADNGIRSDMQDETDARIAADIILTNSINQEIDNRVNSYHYVEELVIAETSSRISADNTLTTNLNTEISNRIAAELWTKTYNYIDDVYITYPFEDSNIVRFNFPTNLTETDVQYDVHYPINNILVSFIPISVDSVDVEFENTQEAINFYNTYNSVNLIVIRNGITIEASITPKNIDEKIKIETVNGLQTILDSKKNIIPSIPYFNLKIYKSDLIWEDCFIKIDTEKLYDSKSVINCILKVNTGYGTFVLNPIIKYPAAKLNQGYPGNYFLLGDTESILTIYNDFEYIEFYFELTPDGSQKIDSLKYNLGGNIIGSDQNGAHSTAEATTISIIYPDFEGDYIQTINDPLTNYGQLNSYYRPTYCQLKGADLVNFPFTNGAQIANQAPTPNILTVGSHSGNSFVRVNLTSSATEFLETTIAVGAHRQDPTDHTGASSYGFGLEFSEVSGRQEMNDTYGSGLGDLWHSTFYNVYQQSPSCGIVTAKFRKIKDSTNVSWSIIRLACRATASNNGVWNMYTGYGVINVDAAIAYINTNYKSAEAINQAADNLEGTQGLNPIITYNTLLDNSPISKKLVKDTKFGTDTNNSYFDADGMLHMNGNATVYDDLIGDITSLKTVGTRVTLNEINNSIDFTSQATMSDYAYINFQLPHKWEIGSTLYPHVHWEQASGNTPNWLFQYRWQKQGQAKETNWTNYKSNTNAFAYTSGTLNQISHNGGIVPPVGASLSDIIEIRIIRDTVNASGLFTGATPYTGTASVTSMDIHYRIDSLGSNTEYTK